MTLTWPITRPADKAGQVTYDAPCPNCGNPCQWTGIREDCRVRSEVECGCGGAA